MIRIKNITLSAHWQKKNRDRIRKFAFSGGFGIEITTFATPNWYYKKNKELLKNALQTHIEEFRNFPNRLSIHGPIMDIIPHTVDEEIRKMVHRRVVKTMKLAHNLKIKKVIFHTGINPIVTAPGYYNLICKRQAEFWNEILDRFKNNIICLENMWEPDTKILRRILRHSKHSRLKICLDVAHTNVYGNIPLKEWFRKLGRHIAHIHINDNNGQYDEHLPLGEGTMNWDMIFSEINKLENNPQVVIELPEMNKLKKTLRFMKRNKYME